MQNFESPTRRLEQQSTTSRSPSPEWTAKRSDGFRQPRNVAREFDAGWSKPVTAPGTRPALARSATSGSVHSFGGGGRATTWQDLESYQLPSVPSAHSMQSLPESTGVTGRELKLPWNAT